MGADRNSRDRHDRSPEYDATVVALSAVIGNSEALAVGQAAIAIGSPLGTFTESVTRGIISGTGARSRSRTRAPGDR